MPDLDTFDNYVVDDPEREGSELIYNGDFELESLRQWNVQGSNTLERSPDQAYAGTHSMKCTYQDNINLAITHTLTADSKGRVDGTMHIFSMRIYIPSSYTGTILQLWDGGTFTSATGTQVANVDMTLTDQWQLVRMDIIPNDSFLTGTLRLREAGTAPAAGEFIYIDDVSFKKVAHEGDGLAEGSGTGNWDSGTNKNLNGGAESNTTHWASVGGGSFSRTLQDSKFGKACFEVESDDNGAAGFWTSPTTSYIAATQNEVWTISMWVKPLETVGNNDFQIRIDEFDSSDVAGTTTDYRGSAAVATLEDLVEGEWNRCYITHTMVDADCAKFRITIRNQDAFDYRVDGIQAHEDKKWAPYVETNGSEASRTGANIKMDTSNVPLDETQSWVAVRCRPWSWDSTESSLANTGFVFCWTDDADNQISFRWRDSSAAWDIRRTTASSISDLVADSFSDGEWLTLIYAWDATDIHFSTGGAAFVTTASATIPTLTSTDLNIGHLSALSSWNGHFAWVAFGTGTLTDADAAAIAGAGNETSFRAFEELPGGAASPIAFWNAITGDQYQTTNLGDDDLASLGAG